MAVFLAMEGVSGESGNSSEAKQLIACGARDFYHDSIFGVANIARESALRQPPRLTQRYRPNESSCRVDQPFLKVVPTLDRTQIRFLRALSISVVR